MRAVVSGIGLVISFRGSGHWPGRLRGVVGVDVDVVGGEVGGPEDARAGALMELDGDAELGLLKIGVGGGFVELCRATAVAADGQSAEVDVDPVGIDFRA